jgi:hypothetical protein
MTVEGARGPRGRYHRYGVPKCECGLLSAADQYEPGLGGSVVREESNNNVLMGWVSA